MQEEMTVFNILQLFECIQILVVNSINEKCSKKWEFGRRPLDILTFDGIIHFENGKVPGNQ